MATTDFITINGQFVRVTSLVRNGGTGALSLVVIVRGDAARDELNALLGQAPLAITLPEQAPAAMHVTDCEVRSTGEGARTIHRFAFVLEPDRDEPEPGVAHEGKAPADERTLEERLTAIERKLDRLLALVTRDDL